MVIALIGGQLAENKDDVQRNPGRWDYYLDMLARPEYGYVKPGILILYYTYIKLLVKCSIVKFIGVYEENSNIINV
jgi:hypothetical protein